MIRASLAPGEKPGARQEKTQRKGFLIDPDSIDQETLVKGIGRQVLATVLRDEDLVLELDPILAAHRSDISFDTERHPRLQLAFVAVGLHVLGIADARVALSTPRSSRPNATLSRTVR